MAKQFRKQARKFLNNERNDVSSVSWDVGCDIGGSPYISAAISVSTGGEEVSLFSYENAQDRKEMAAFDLKLRTLIEELTAFRAAVNDAIAIKTT